MIVRASAREPPPSPVTGVLLWQPGPGPDFPGCTPAIRHPRLQLPGRHPESVWKAYTAGTSLVAGSQAGRLREGGRRGRSGWRSGSAARLCRIARKSTNTTILGRKPRKPGLPINHTRSGQKVVPKVVTLRKSGPKVTEKRAQTDPGLKRNMAKSRNPRGSKVRK